MSIERFADLAAEILRRPARLGTVRVVAVDGPAGAGKSTFAGRLAAALRAKGTQVAVIHTDDLLEGWADIVSFWPRLQEWIVEPLSRGEPARYRAYDWVAARFEDQWRTVAVPQVLIIEGVSSARSEASAYLSLGVYVDAPAPLRLDRGLERDGEQLRDEWIRWMSGEDRHFAADRTRARADVIVDGTKQGQDPETEFVRVRAA